jgi:hypothetical protein
MNRNGRIEAEILKPLEQAAVTKVVLIQVPLLRASLLRRLPALAGACRRLPTLSSLRGHRPAQEIRCPAVGKSVSASRSPVLA